MPLEALNSGDTHVADLTPLQGMSLTTLCFPARTAAGRLVRQWRRQVKVGASEVWTMPKGCNVFPER